MRAQPPVVDFVHQRRTVADLHALDPFADRLQPPTEFAVWWCDPSDSAVALGSRQRPEVLDAQACADAGLAIVRRRSGGGAVLVDPACAAWCDLVIPAAIELTRVPGDVRGVMEWVGERWCEAISEVAPDVSRRLVVHRGGMVDTAWSEFVCFAGVGPGEVLLEGRKLVGLSQRRTRLGARVQAMIHLAEPSADLTQLFAVPVPEAPLPPPAVLPGVTAAEIVEALRASVTAALGGRPNRR